MILIKLPNGFRVVADYDIGRYKNKKGVVILGFLDTDKYPCLKTLKVSNRNIKDFKAFVEKKIKDKESEILSYKNQLDEFKNDIKSLGGLFK